MAERSWVIVIDFGTSGVSASAVDPEEGTIHAGSSKKYQWLHPEPGLTEIDPDEIWECSQVALSQLIRELTSPFRLIGISFSFFGDNVIPVDENGKAIDNLLPAIDGRSEEQVPEMLERVSPDEFYRITGGLPGSMCIGSKILWLRQHRPQIYERAHSFDHIQQYIFRRMGLGPASDYTMMSRKMLYDIRTREWPESLLAPLGIHSRSLDGPLYESTHVLGTVDEYGTVSLSEEVPIVVGAHDVTCALIGGGAIVQNRGVFADVTGTFVNMGRITERVELNEEESDPRCWLSSGPRDGWYSFFASIPTAGALLEWFVSEVHDDDSNMAFEELFQAVDFDGTGNLLTIPYFDRSRGVLSGLDLSTSRIQIFRSLVEGITYEYRSILEASGSFFEDPIRTVHAGGGGSKSSKWLQLKADVSRTRVRKVSNPEISTLGSSVLALTSLGVYESFEDAISNLVELEETYSPQPERAERYETLYKKFIELKQQGPSQDSFELD